MRKLAMAVLFAALGARAEGAVTNGLEEASAPIETATGSGSPSPHGWPLSADVQRMKDVTTVV